jgi:MFS family permease
MSLPPFIATSLGLIICGPLSDWIILFLAKRNKGIYEPEMRLWVIAAFIPFVPARLFIFSFGLANGAAWPVLAVGYGLLSFGCSPASAIALTYLTDAYTDVRYTYPSKENFY